MRLAITLNNSLVFQPVVVPMPTEAEISKVLYEDLKYRNTCSTEKEKERFICQWVKLVDRFSKIVLEEIKKDLFFIQENLAICITPWLIVCRKELQTALKKWASFDKL